MAAKEFVSRRYPEVRTLDWITSWQDLTNGHLLHAVYEWELIHSAVRMLLQVIQPNSTLPTTKPNLAQGWKPDDGSTDSPDLSP